MDNSRRRFLGKVGGVTLTSIVFGKCSPKKTGVSSLETRDAAQVAVTDALPFTQPEINEACRRIKLAIPDLQCPNQVQLKKFFASMRKHPTLAEFAETHPSIPASWLNNPAISKVYVTLSRYCLQRPTGQVADSESELIEIAREYIEASPQSGMALVPELSDSETSVAIGIPVGLAILAVLFALAGFLPMSEGDKLGARIGAYFLSVLAWLAAFRK